MSERDLQTQSNSATIKVNARVAVVILNWNGAAMMRRFLPSVVAHSEEAQVIVADNGSTDESLAMLAEEFPSVSTLPLDKNYGFAEGYNRALAQIEADFYVLLNSDVEVTPHWLQPLLTYMEAHPEVAACQPKLLAENARERFEYAGAAGGYLDKYGYPFCRGRILDEVETDKGQYDSITPILWASGAALFVRRNDWENARGLDARFFAHMEEIDLCWRLRSRGRGIVCVPESVVYHVGGGTLNAGSPRKTFLNFRNNLLMLYKNLPEAELRRVMFVRRVLDYIAAAKFLVTDGWAHAKAVVSARNAYRQMRDSYALERQKNLSLHVETEIKERMPYSLLKLFYVKKLRHFSSLKEKGYLD